MNSGAASFVVYVDESGDEGFCFEAGASDWLVLAAFVTWKPADLATVKLVDEVRAALGKPAKKPLHFRKLSHLQRLLYCSEIAKSKGRIVAVALHKPSLPAPEEFRLKSQLYFYAVMLLLERVSWLCQSAWETAKQKGTQRGDGVADVEFSNKSSMSYRDMREYLGELRHTQDVKIDWNIIDESRMTPYQHDSRMGLQIADAVASSFDFGCQKLQLGFCEGRYATTLKPIVYKREGVLWQYGFTVWPSLAEAKLELDGEHGWICGFK